MAMRPESRNNCRSQKMHMCKNDVSRREFLKSSIRGIGGFIYLSSNDKTPEKKNIEKNEEGRKFIYRTLGRTGIRVPVISMGVMNSDNPNLVRAALDAGIIHLDTARGYQRGQNERMIGEVIKGRARNSFVIATKARLPKNFVDGLFRQNISDQLDTSLKSLGLEYVDILYNHNVVERESAISEPMLKVLQKAKKEGKARFVGISTHANEPEVIQAAIDSKIYDVILTSYNFRQKHYGNVREAIAKASQSGLGVIAMKAMGGARDVNAAAALKWVLQDPNVHTIISGFTTFEQMNIDISVMENPAMSDSEKEYLRMEASLTGIYCQGCGECMKQCRAKIPIPDIMRAYMYAYGYGNPGLGQELIVSLDLPGRVCEDCSLCPVKCKNAWNIAGKICDIIRLREVPSEFLA